MSGLFDRLIARTVGAPSTAAPLVPVHDVPAIEAEHHAAVPFPGPEMLDPPSRPDAGSPAIEPAAVPEVDAAGPTASVHHAPAGPEAAPPTEAGPPEVAVVPASPRPLADPKPTGYASRPHARPNPVAAPAPALHVEAAAPTPETPARYEDVSTRPEIPAPDGHSVAGAMHRTDSSVALPPARPVRRVAETAPSSGEPPRDRRQPNLVTARRAATPAPAEPPAEITVSIGRVVLAAPPSTPAPPPAEPRPATHLTLSDYMARRAEK